MIHEQANEETEKEVKFPEMNGNANTTQESRGGTGDMVKAVGGTVKVEGIW